MVVMRDVAISRSEFVQDQKAVSKLQDFQEDSELFRYCSLPQVPHTHTHAHRHTHTGTHTHTPRNCNKHK